MKKHLGKILLLLGAIAGVITIVKFLSAKSQAQMYVDSLTRANAWSAANPINPFE